MYNILFSFFCEPNIYLTKIKLFLYYFAIL